MLHRVSPVDAAVLDWQWSAKTGELFLLVRRDVDRDRHFTDRDGAELISSKGPVWPEGVGVLEPAVREALERAIH